MFAGAQPENIGRFCLAFSRAAQCTSRARKSRERLRAVGARLQCASPSCATLTIQCHARPGLRWAAQIETVVASGTRPSTILSLFDRAAGICTGSKWQILTFVLGRITDQLSAAISMPRAAHYARASESARARCPRAEVPTTTTRATSVCRLTSARVLCGARHADRGAQSVRRACAGSEGRFVGFKTKR